MSWVLEHPTFLDSEARALFSHLGPDRVDELLGQLEDMEVIAPAGVAAMRLSPIRPRHETSRSIGGSSWTGGNRVQAGGGETTSS